MLLMPASLLLGAVGVVLGNLADICLLPARLYLKLGENLDEEPQ